MPIEKFYGIGKVTAAKFKSYGVNNGADLNKLTEEELVERFGKSDGSSV